MKTNIVKYCKLPFTFSVDILQQEVMSIETQQWKSHYNTMNYEGDWSAIPLLALDGNTENIHATHSDSAIPLEYKPTTYLDKCPGVNDVLRSFQCELRSVRLMNLTSGAIIKEHSDYQLSYEEGEVRIHIPIITNPFVEFYVEKECVVMNEGECWYLNLSLPHRVHNLGTTNRVHLVIDAVVNPWLISVIESSEKVCVEVNKKEKFDKETLSNIIHELVLQDTETSRSLARSLQTQLDEHSTNNE